MAEELLTRRTCPSVPSYGREGSLELVFISCSARCRPGCRVKSKPLGADAAVGTHLSAQPPPESPAHRQGIVRASLLPRVLCRASHLCQGEEVVSGSPLSGAGFHTPLCPQNHRIIGKDSSDAACRDTWSRWYWQSFSWVVSELQKPKPRGHGLHPCSSMMCKKGTSNGTGVVCATGRSSEEGQLQDKEGTFPDKTSLCTGNLFKRKM